MQNQEIYKLDVEMKPFLVKEGDNEHQYYKMKYDIDMTGKLTQLGKLKWLEFRGVVSIQDLEKSIYKVRVDNRGDEKTSCLNYLKTCELLEAYLNMKARLNIGKMGVKTYSKSEINPEEIPF